MTLATAVVAVASISMAATMPARQALSGDRRPAAGAQAVAEPDGYRLSDYRAPTPLTLRGGRRIGNEVAMAMWREKKALFIDVLPYAPKPRNLPRNTIWREKVRYNIPGSIWLANVGFGRPGKERLARFRAQLHRLTGGDLDRPIVIYCLAQCWMSWNAAKRAIAFGYRSVHWYAQGTDGWAKIGGKLAPSKPVLPAPAN